ncbi:MAG: hypothetical protein JSS82_09975 [Bacteroidetes bacterium]|nr:hypothetical protein [Bacteroidota bacterium]
MHTVRLNFLAFAKQNFSVAIYRREAPQVENFDDQYSYYDFKDINGANKKYEITGVETVGFEKYNAAIHVDHHIVSNRVYDRLIEASKLIDGYFIRKSDDVRNKRIHFNLESHPKGKKCVWIEPYFLKSQQKWGILLGFQFVVDESILQSNKFTLDKDILIASGSLNSRGQSNLDFYLFKHNYIKQFIQNILPQISSKFALNFHTELFELASYQLKPKEYFFKDGYTSSSAYYGLYKSAPLSNSISNQIYDFIYLEEDRNYAVSLLKGLRGETHPNTFNGIEKLFKVPFTNDNIHGSPLKSFSDDEIDTKIKQIKEDDKNILPVIITKSKNETGDDKLYYWLKNKFTNAGIPCQVVTKDLIQNENAIKFSLANIGLQIFAKSGGKPWKMKPAGSDYLIIGIGQSYNIENTPEGNTIEKNTTYSVLTDSSGIFKDIQILSEGMESDDTYWQKLVTNISALINNTQSKKVALHVPFRISKSKVLEKVAGSIGSDVELSVLVINDKTDYFGFDYANNGLVPFEGTFVKLSKFEYLAWFEGIQPNNPKITKRFGNPLLIKFWYSNKPELLENYSYRESLLQDCINLSGANWRGFKSKQLPVSIYYCQRIAEFIAKFREFHLEHIEINNLKPWFL